MSNETVPHPDAPATAVSAAVIRPSHTWEASYKRSKEPDQLVIPLETNVEDIIFTRIRPQPQK